MIVLHYAPDNASLAVRLALEEAGLPYRTVLIDRARRGEKAPDYLRINPHGRIPAIETETGPIFETAAILLWLSDRHAPQLFPRPDAAERGTALSWLFWLSNTLHPALNMLFRPHQHIGPEGEALLVAATRAKIRAMLDTLDAHLDAEPAFFRGEGSILDAALVQLLRWAPLYPAGQDRWFDLAAWPATHRLARRVEARPATVAAAAAEGLGPTPYTAPRMPTPPEGSPT